MHWSFVVSGPAAYTVFNSVRVWWLWLIGREVVHHEVEAVIGNEWE